MNFAVPSVRFGYCSGTPSSRIQSGVRSAMREYAQAGQPLPARLTPDQYDALSTRLGNIEAAVQGISQILNRHFGQL